MGVIQIIALALIAAGFVFVGIELFLPGFGWPGITGIICFVAGIFTLAKSFQQGMVITLIVLAVLGLLFCIVMRLLAKGKFRSPLILKEEMNDNGGYVGSKGLDSMVGASGTAVTDLHPAGRGLFDGQELDVITNGKYILKGTPITVISAESYRLTVDEAE